MSERTYAIAEHFMTLQGEGVWAGTPAYFIRLAGCNLWSGHDDTRSRDAERSRATCPLFCDTDFLAKEKLSTGDLIQIVMQQVAGLPQVVITGGEPLIQLRADLPQLILDLGIRVAIETNGTQPLPPDLIELKDRCGDGLWVTCSPKRKAEELRIDPNHVNELKVVFPSYDPASFEDWAYTNKRMALFVQPEAATFSVGNSLIDKHNQSAAASWCVRHPRWRLSIQTHKILGIP